MFINSTEVRWTYSLWFRFWIKPYTIKHLEHSMCSSRKYPYPHAGFFQFDPHPQDFPFQGGLYSTPPIPWNFHDLFTWVPLPLGNSIAVNNKTSVIYFNLLGTVIKFSHSYSCLYCRQRHKVACFFTNNFKPWSGRTTYTILSHVSCGDIY